MRKFTLTHLLLIAGGVLLGVLVYIAPNINKENSELLKKAETEHLHSDAEKADKTAPSPVKKGESLAKLEKHLSTASDPGEKLILLDSLIAISIQENKPPLVAKYTEDKAKLFPTEENWMASGDNYYKAFRLSRHQSVEMVKEAIESYEKVLQINPENLEAEASIGVAYVEGAALLGEMPMKGIGILLNILEKDPNNINALTNLGYFAIQSKQFEKAIERFEKVLELEPENAEAYLYLTDIYVSMGEYQKGIENLEKYKTLIKDPLVEQQVDKYIEELKNK